LIHAAFLALNNVLHLEEDRSCSAAMAVAAKQHGRLGSNEATQQFTIHIRINLRASLASNLQTDLTLLIAVGTLLAGIGLSANRHTV